VLDAEVGKVSLNMSQDQVLEAKGQPASRVPIKESLMEVWEYNSLTITFESGKVSQVVGSEPLSIGAKTFPLRITLDDLSSRLAVSSAVMPGDSSSPTLRSVPAKDGSLTIGQSKGEVTMYGIQRDSKETIPSR
jgi:hypothetical protein